MRHFNESRLKGDSDKEFFPSFSVADAQNEAQPAREASGDTSVNKSAANQICRCVRCDDTLLADRHPCLVCVSVCRYAAAVQDGSQYFVLLIITDGVISDMAQTKEAIVNVSAAAAVGGVSGLLYLHCMSTHCSFRLTWVGDASEQASQQTFCRSDQFPIIQSSLSSAKMLDFMLEF